MGYHHFLAEVRAAMQRLRVETAVANVVRCNADPGDLISRYELARQLLAADFAYVEKLTALAAEGRIAVYEKGLPGPTVRVRTLHGDEFADLLPDYPGWTE